MKRKAGMKNGSSEVCYICDSMIPSIGKYVDMVVKALDGYEFGSFELGSRIPTAVVEREDNLRSEMKLKGGETVKSTFTREMNNLVSQRLDVKVKHRTPDLTAVVDTILDTVEVTPRPIHVYGRYIKTARGIQQKRRRCTVCRGRGCPECSLTGYLDIDSVEQRLTEPLLTLFKANRVRFTWIGSEDHRSLVLGRGRPFYAEISEPHVRNPRGVKTAVGRRVGAGVSLKELKILSGEPLEERRFTVTVRSGFTVDKRVLKKDLKMLEDVFRDVSVSVATPNKRNIASKNIYSLTVESAKGRNIQVKVECDGGLSIRRFLTGEGGEVTPNLATVVNRQVALDEEKPFDILDVGF